MSEATRPSPHLSRTSAYSAGGGVLHENALLCGLIGVSIVSHVAFLCFGGGGGRPPVVLAVQEGVSSIRLNAYRKQAPLQDFKPKEVKKRTEKVDSEPTPDAEKLVRRDVEKRFFRETPSVEFVEVPPPQKREIPEYVEESVASRPVERKVTEILPDSPEVQLISQEAQAESRGARTNVVTSASFLYNPAPVYPAEDRAARRGGTVEVLVRVSAAGTVEWAKLKSSTGTPQMDRNTLDVIRSWRFHPALNAAGRPTAQEVVLPYRFDPFLVDSALR